MSTAADIVAAARSYLRTKFVHRGRLPGVGIDCIGLAVCAAAQCGVPLRDVLTYGRAPKPEQLLAELDAQLDRVEISDAAPGDVAVFWVDRADLPRHVGVLFGMDDGGLGVVHALAMEREVREHRLTGYWAARLTRVYRLRGVER